MTAPTSLLLKQAGSNKWLWIVLGVIAVVLVIFFVGKKIGKEKGTRDTEKEVADEKNKTTSPDEAGIPPDKATMTKAELANATGDAQYFIELEDSLWVSSIDDSYTNRLATARDIYALSVANMFKSNTGTKLSTYLENLWYKDDTTNLAIQKLRTLGV